MKPYPATCEIHCTVCEGADHHWLPDCDEETGEPLDVCKHCDAQRPYQGEDEDYREYGAREARS